MSSPTQGILSVNTFANDAAFVTFKGSAAVLGDFYMNSTDNNLRVHDGTIFQTVEDVKNSFAETTDPSATDDSDSDYAVGSKWINVTLDKAFINVDSTAAAAVWKEITPGAFPNLNQVTKTANFTLTAANDVIFADATSGAFTLTLPAAAANDGKQFTLVKIDSSVNDVTIDGNAAETIDGSTTILLEGQFQSIKIISDGTNWFSGSERRTLTAYIKDIKSTGTDGGSFVTGAWRTRDLNTIEGDSSIVTLSANQFTLGPGTYYIESWTPAYFVDRHRARLQDITAGATIDEGINTFTAAGAMSNAVLKVKLTITASNVYEIQHRNQTARTNTGFGINSNAAFPVDNEHYTLVKIIKVN